MDAYPGYSFFKSIRKLAQISLIVGFWSVSGDLKAQLVYSYEDDDGVTHFTDRPPSDMEGVEVQHAFVSPQPITVMRKAGTRPLPEWWFRNRLHGPVAVQIVARNSENAQTNPRLPAVQILGPLEDRRLLAVRSANRTQQRRFSFRTASVPGRPDVRHRPKEPYSLPFAPGRQFTVGQGFGGAFSHNSPRSFHAVDFSMPIGTSIHAARSGVVMEIARWFHESGLDLDRYGPRANFIRLLHDDGTMAIYAHLDFDGIAVRPGERVDRGQRIGRSGNTGFSTGPHLHFVVQKNRGMELVSVPVEFETAQGVMRHPTGGTSASAPSGQHSR